MKEYKKEDSMPLVSDKTKLNIVLILLIVLAGMFLYKQFTVEIQRSKISKMIRNTILLCLKKREYVQSKTSTGL